MTSELTSRCLGFHTGAQRGLACKAVWPEKEGLLHFTLLKLISTSLL